MSLFNWIGFFGLLFIILAWIPENIKSIRSGKSTRKEFTLLYILGSSLLAFHALHINDLIFLILNSLGAILSSMNLIVGFLKAEREQKGNKERQDF